MKELHQIVSDKLSEMINSGAIEEIISKNLVKTVEESVEKALRSYGDFGKVVSKKIEDAIMFSESDINLPLYNTLIADRIHTAFSKAMNENALTHFENLVADIVEPMPKEAKFSDIMDDIKKCWAEESERGNVEVESNYNDDDTALYVSIKHPEYDWHNIKITFYNWKKKTWHIGYLRVGEKTLSIDPRKYADNGMGATNLGDRLFKYFLSKTEFEADEEFESICGDY